MPPYLSLGGLLFLSCLPSCLFVTKLKVLDKGNYVICTPIHLWRESWRHQVKKPKILNSHKINRENLMIRLPWSSTLNSDFNFSCKFWTVKYRNFERCVNFSAEEILTHDFALWPSPLPWVLVFYKHILLKGDKNWNISIWSLTLWGPQAMIVALSNDVI